MIQFVLLDIEGTTTDIQFVHKVLFPYSQQYLKPFVQENQDNPEVQEALAQVQETVLQEEDKSITTDEALRYLMHWIVSDRKHGALKTLQGLIWDEGFRTEAFKGHVYPDVPNAFEQWKAMGLKIGIYSSGSVHAQKLLFGYSEFGDLTPNFSAHFDTVIGGKKEMAAYQNIISALKLSPSEILFVSDVPDELVAAKEAGLNVLHSLRPGIQPDSRFEAVKSFDDVTAYLKTVRV